MKRAYIFIIPALILFSCLKEKAAKPVDQVDFPCGDTVKFSTVIQPNIINMSCNISGCHDAATASASISLSTHAEVAAAADQVLNAIKHESGFAAMPFGSPQLSDSLIEQFRCWIDQGKLNN